jgi:hypothetical protein
VDRALILSLDIFVFQQRRVCSIDYMGAEQEVTAYDRTANFTTPNWSSSSAIQLLFEAFLF